MDLSTTYLGLNLRTPLVVSASPMQEELHNIIEMVDAGASAIVLHSLFEEQLVTEQHELFFHLTHGTDSFAEALSYFPEPDDLETGPDRYLQHIQAAKAAVDVPIIASLNGSTMGGWTAFAKQIEEAGADALELNIYNIPTDIDTTGAQVEAGYMEIARAVRAAVDIPISVKLSPFFSSIPNIAKQFDEAKIDGLVLFNRFYQPDFDIDELEVNRKVLLSTPPEMRLPLNWIGILFGRVGLDLAATTGVHSAEDAIKMLMAGANVTMMASALFKYGIKHIRTVENEMRQWLVDHEYESVVQMRGSMSQLNISDPSAFERAQYVRTVSTLPTGYTVH
ncbi:MAG: dihydroorotate dehydrogenase-like protein [Chloroflexota bacterium]